MNTFLLPAQINRADTSQVAPANGSEDSFDPVPMPDFASSRVLKGIKGIIFDFDGTLFDNAFIGFNLVTANPLDIFLVRNERLVRRRFASCDYSSSENYYRAFFSAMGKVCFCSPERIQNWYFNRYMPRMVRMMKNKYLLRPGVQELFRRFESSTSPDTLKFAVYSDYPFLKERFEAMGFYPGPRLPLYGPESFGAQKPAVRPLLRIAGDLGLPPEKILVIGDREETDGIGAFKAGMRFFLLETGHTYYIPLDPNRSRIKEQSNGPELVMYAGTWNHLLDLLMKK